jgi:hypothetical protein
MKSKKSKLQIKDLAGKKKEIVPRRGGDPRGRGRHAIAGWYLHLVRRLRLLIGTASGHRRLTLRRCPGGLSRARDDPDRLQPR